MLKNLKWFEFEVCRAALDAKLEAEFVEFATGEAPHASRTLRRLALDALGIHRYGQTFEFFTTSSGHAIQNWMDRHNGHPGAENIFP